VLVVIPRKENPRVLIRFRVATLDADMAARLKQQIGRRARLRGYFVFEGHGPASLCTHLVCTHAEYEVDAPEFEAEALETAGSMDEAGTGAEGQAPAGRGVRGAI
jgi:hypothetical protein